MTFKNAISWFEIPTRNIDRAQKFYETVFDISMIALDMPQIRMRLFPVTDLMNGISGALCDSGGFHTPSEDKGPLIYLNANPDVQIILNKIEAAGGRIIVPKTQISPEHGYMAIFIDSEGNRVALHSVPEK